MVSDGAQPEEQTDGHCRTGTASRGGPLEVVRPSGGKTAGLGTAWCKAPNAPCARVPGWLAIEPGALPSYVYDITDMFHESTSTIEQIGCVDGAIGLAYVTVIVHFLAQDKTIEVILRVSEAWVAAEDVRRGGCVPDPRKGARTGVWMITQRRWLAAEGAEDGEMGPGYLPAKGGAARRLRSFGSEGKQSPRGGESP